MSSPTIDPEIASAFADPEFQLLGIDLITEGFDSTVNEGLKDAPLFTGDAFRICGAHLFPQRALYGRIMGQEFKGFPTTVQSPKLYINTNAPFSALTCGVQGSGKSHSTSVILESCLIRDERLGTLPEPLSALLFHFDTAAGGGHAQPCEAAYLASLDETRGGNAKPPKVTVLVMPNTLRAMKKVYADLPGVTVEALHFAPEDMSGERLLAMMKVEQDQGMPLYMECIMNILRSMEEIFDYANFRQQLKDQNFSPVQKSMLDLRLNLLDSCLEGGSALNRVSKHFGKGKLTIIDLSSPFMDGSSACGFFDIILGLFIEAKSERPRKLVVLDEAHKYLTSSGSSSRLTDSLLSIIRQQRHLGTRVLISTQEPTVVPSKFLDLCSFVIAHRFSSPKWLDHLKQHISAVDNQSFSRAFTLKTGEAMIFSPAGVGLREVSERGVTEPSCAPFGPGYLLVRSRERITADGGGSVLAASATGPRENLSPTIPVQGGNEFPIESVGTYQRVLSPLTGSSVASDTHSSGDTQPGTRNTTPAGSMESMSNAAVASLSPSMSRRPDVILKAEPRFKPLVATLLAQPGGRMSWSDLGTEFKNRRLSPYQGKLRLYLEEAAVAGLVKLVLRPYNWVEVCVPIEYEALVETLRRIREEGQVDPPTRDMVAGKLNETYPVAFTGSFEDYVQGAEAAGLIRCTKKGRISLP